MPHFCAAGECTNNSERHPNLSFHGLPLHDKGRLKVWITKMRRDPRYFNVTKHTKICSQHFRRSDYIEPDTSKKRLKCTAVPTLFKWTKSAADNSSEDATRPAVKKLEACRLEEEEETDTASEGEGDALYSLRPQILSRKTQTYKEDCCDEIDPLPCSHKFSVSHLLSKCVTKKKEEKLFKHFTGFDSYKIFSTTLEFLLPNLDRHNMIYWGTAKAMERLIDTGKFFDEDFSKEDTGSKQLNSNEEFLSYKALKPHKLSVGGEFLMMLMRLRMGLTEIDLAERFNISESTVSLILVTWLNYMYIILGSLKIWPHRKIILDNCPKGFKEKYPNTLIIIDATELKIQVPSSLQKQSQTYSNYKSYNTLKCLLGVDPKGGIIFVSQLYEGSISDKELVKRCGLLEVLQQKMQVGEIARGDALMADKGFDIKNDLEALGLTLNIPPFLKEKGSFSEDDIIKTQTIATHRIHVERAIAKIRRFRIFHSVIPVAMLGTINQIWTVACLLSNFQNPVL